MKVAALKTLHHFSDFSSQAILYLFYHLKLVFTSCMSFFSTVFKTYFFRCVYAVPLYCVNGTLDTGHNERELIKSHLAAFPVGKVPTQPGQRVPDVLVQESIPDILIRRWINNLSLNYTSNKILGLLLHVMKDTLKNLQWPKINCWYSHRTYWVVSFSDKNDYFWMLSSLCSCHAWSIWYEKNILFIVYMCSSAV